MSCDRRAVCLLVCVCACATSLVAAQGVHETAEAAFQQGDLGRAARIGRAHLAEHPDDARMTVLVGLIQLRRAEGLERAGRPAAEVAAGYASARETLLRAERLSPDRPLRNLQHGLGLAWMAQRRLAEAIERFSRAIAEQPERAELHRLRGTCRLETGETVAAVEDLARAAELAPRDLPLRRDLARALYQLGRPEDARRTMEDFLRQIDDEPADDRHFEALYEVFTYALLANDFDRAVRALEAARPIRPDNLTLRSELGALYYRQGRFEEADAEYAAILAVADAPPSLAFKAHHHRGLVHQHAGRHEQARQEFERALALEPNRAEVLRSYGAALRRLGHHERAREVLERFRRVVGPENDIRLSRNRLRKNPRDRSAHVRLVTLLLELERTVEAREALGQFRRAFPRDPSIPGFEARLGG